MTLITKLLGKTTGIEVGPSFAVFVNEPAVGEFGPQFGIELR